MHIIDGEEDILGPQPYTRTRSVTLFHYIVVDRY